MKKLTIFLLFALIALCVSFEESEDYEDDYIDTLSNILNYQDLQEAHTLSLLSPYYEFELKKLKSKLQRKASEAKQDIKNVYSALKRAVDNVRNGRPINYPNDIGTILDDALNRRTLEFDEEPTLYEDMDQ